MDCKNEFIEKLNYLDIKLDENQINQFDTFMNDMLKWNKKVRLTSITEEKNIIDKHFVDSLSVLITDIFEKNAKILDIGTGGGFPGIPLKIYDRSFDLTMIDSRLKKIEYVNHLINKYNFKNTEAFHKRAENLANEKKYREKYDIVVSRAVANMATLSEYCLPFVKLNGFFVAMKGPKDEKEINNSKYAIKKLGGKIQKVIELKLPKTDMERSLIIIKKIKNTPSKYPRRPGRPKNKPLVGDN
ncbi:MAG: 16S rRNA (guanine(527)-N(7))-methyltransferase RsmG [Bacillota bacterium]